MLSKTATQIFAHRGSKGTHPENTLAAFQEALRLGCDGLELDVHLSKDGVPIVIHDETVDRTSNGKGWVQEQTVAELKQLDAGTWFHARFQGEQIPTLREVLVLLKEQRFKGCLNIELKTDQIQYEEIEAAVLETVRQEEGSFHVVYSSFHYDTLVRLKNLDTTADIALLFSGPDQNYYQIGEGIPVQGWHPRITVFRHIARHDPKGIDVRYWTVNGIAELTLCYAKKVDAVITDFPKRAMKLRKMLQGE